MAIRAGRRSRRPAWLPRRVHHTTPLTLPCWSRLVRSRPVGPTSSPHQRTPRPSRRRRGSRAPAAQPAGASKPPANVRLTAAARPGLLRRRRRRPVRRGPCGFRRAERPRPGRPGRAGRPHRRAPGDAAGGFVPRTPTRPLSSSTLADRATTATRPASPPPRRRPFRSGFAAPRGTAFAATRVCPVCPVCPVWPQ